MARDNRKIVRGVRIGDALYKTGQEDELAKVSSQEQLKRFAENGTIEGDWGVTAAPEVDTSINEEEAAAQPSRGRPRLNT